MGSTSSSKVDERLQSCKFTSFCGIFSLSNCCILNSFIENFGTHVITSVTIGGKDVIYVKQHLTSPISIVEIKNYVQDIGNQRFSSPEGLTNSGLLKNKAGSIFPSHLITLTHDYFSSLFIYI